MTRTVKIGGQTALLNNWSVNSIFNRRQTLSGTVVGPNITAPVVGQTIEIYFIDELYSEYVYIFRGIITAVTGKMNGLQAEYTISAEDFSVITSWRITSFAAFNKTAKEIILEYIKPILIEEDFDWDDGFIDDGASFKKAVFNMKTVEEVLNSIADSSGCMWQVTYPEWASGPVLRFGNVEQSEEEVEVITDDFPCKIQRKQDEKNYRNVQTLVGNVSQTATQNETLAVNDAAYITRFPVALQPDIYVGGVLQTDIGISGLDTGATWLWSYQSREISYNGSGTAPAQIQVVYVGLYTVITRAQNAAQITQKSNIWGTGRRENVTKNTNIDDVDVASQEAQTLLETYCNDNDVLSVSTEYHLALHEGIAEVIGETLVIDENYCTVDNERIDLTFGRYEAELLNLNISYYPFWFMIGYRYYVERSYLDIMGTYICSSITLSPIGIDGIKVSASLSNGKTATWIDYFKKLAAPAKDVNISENEVAQVEHSVSESADFDGVLGIIVNSRLYPASNLYPANTLYPGVPATEVFIND